MIARRWRGWADGSTQADAYVAYFAGTVRPQLERTDGFLDATLERVQDDRGRTEVIVVTRWTSMDAIHGFAGDEVDLAVVEPEARAVLSAFDTRVRHIELADGDAFGHLEVIDIPAEAVVQRDAHLGEQRRPSRLARTRDAPCPRASCTARAPHDERRFSWSRLPASCPSETEHPFATGGWATTIRLVRGRDPALGHDPGLLSGGRGCGCFRGVPVEGPHFAQQPIRNRLI